MSDPAARPATPPDLLPIAEVFDKAAKQTEKQRQKAEDKAYMLSLLDRKGESEARKVARAMGMPDGTVNKIINDRNRELAKEEAERNPPPDLPPAPSRKGKPPAGDGEGSGPGWTKENVPIKPLPPDCPVTPLGCDSSGKVFYYLTPRQSLFDIARSGHTIHGLRELFGTRQDWLWEHYPKVNEQTRRQTGWKADRCAESLIAAIWARPTFNRNAVVRETGGWKDKAGQLVLHCGDMIWFDGAWVKPGFHGGHLYPASDAMMKPADVADDTTPHLGIINQLLKTLDTFNWTNQGDDENLIGYGADIDGSGHKLASLLLLGHSAAAKAGGALLHRPMLWLTGDTGSGKTTVQDILKALQGEALIKTSNTTGAGLWQALGQSSRPIAVDEAENEPGSQRMRDVIRLAREAATGGVILRGGQQHQGAQFFAQSTFSFSSIIIPPLPGQDMRRMTILEMGSLKDAKPLHLDFEEIGMMGSVISRRLMQGWPRWAETFERYRAALAATGHDPGGCNQHGTLLAMADLMRFDQCADADTIQLLCRALSARAVDASQDKVSNAEAMLRHLTSFPLDVFRGGTRMTIGKLVMIGANINEDDLNKDSPATPFSCRAALEAHGIYFEGNKEDCRIILPNRHTGLGNLFRGTQWESPVDATGAWTQAMRRLPKVLSEASSRITGRGWSVPVRVFLQMPKEKR